MSFSAFAHEVRAAQIAERLYDAAPDARPDWIDDQLLRSGQVAALLQVSRRTIGDWARTGKLDSIMTPGGHRRFRGSDVRALLESLEARSVARQSSRNAPYRPPSLPP